jgi:hypothetical protein
MKLLSIFIIFSIYSFNSFAEYGVTCKVYDWSVEKELIATEIEFEDSVEGEMGLVKEVGNFQVRFTFDMFGEKRNVQIHVSRKIQDGISSTVSFQHFSSAISAVSTENKEFALNYLDTDTNKVNRASCSL